jgi:hypothetical protein
VTGDGGRSGDRCGAEQRGAKRTQRRDGEEVECRQPSLRAFVEDLDEVVACVDGENLCGVR